MFRLLFGGSLKYTTHWRLNLYNYIDDTAIVYAGRSYMVPAGSAKAARLQRAADYYNRREYAQAKSWFRKALRAGDAYNIGLIGGM